MDWRNAAVAGVVISLALVLLWECSRPSRPPPRPACNHEKVIPCETCVDVDITYWAKMDHKRRVEEASVAVCTNCYKAQSMMTHSYP
jgi:hypothetical protein